MNLNKLGIPYTPSLKAYDVRYLLAQSQTNVSGGVTGERYASAAYDLAMEDCYRNTDPTAAGEAASHGELQAERGQYGLDYTDRSTKWYNESIRLLSGDDPSSKREIRATHLNHLRTVGIRLGRLIVNEEYDHSLYTDARESYARAMEGIDADDPYGIMSIKNMAFVEAMVQNAKEATSLSIEGLRLLPGVRTEKLSAAKQGIETSDSRVGKLNTGHLRFVAKQAISLSAAGALAETSRVPGTSKKVSQLALRALL